MSATVKETPEFNSLVKAIKRLRIERELKNEIELERLLREHLKKYGFTVQEQVIKKQYRNDLVVIHNNKKFCLELKKFADLSCTRQLDNYLPEFPDGLILVCWKSSTSLRNVICSVKDKINTPVDIINLRAFQGFV